MSAARKRDRRALDIVDRAHRLLDRLDAAQPAADRPGQPPPARLEFLVRLVLQPDLDVDARAVILDLDRLDLLGRVDDAFGQREAEREILEVGGRGHHHRMRGAGKGKRHRRLLRHHAVAGAVPAARRARRVAWVRGGRIRTASTPPPRARPSMRRLLPRLLIIFALPPGRAVGRRDLHRRHLVFGAVGRPVRIVGGDDVGLRVRVVEGRVDHARSRRGR